MSVIWLGRVEGCKRCKVSENQVEQCSGRASYPSPTSFDGTSKVRSRWKHGDMFKRTAPLFLLCALAASAVAED
eukprot:1182287-Prorocentrum_minimum.AAC.1